MPAHRIPLTEGEMEMLIRTSGVDGNWFKGVCTFALGSGDLVLPAPRWALEALATSRGVSFDTSEEEA